MAPVSRPSVARWAAFSILAAAFTVGSTGCDPAESFSDIPEIAPLRVEQKDSTETGGLLLSQIDVVVSWKDGNGDLGVLPRNRNPNDYNYFLTVQKKKGGAFVTLTPLLPNGFSGRFKNLNPENDSSTRPFKLRGELRYRLNSPGIPVLPPSSLGTVNGAPEIVRPGDILRFQVQIKDRAGNLSNVITTEEVAL